MKRCLNCKKIIDIRAIRCKSCAQKVKKIKWSEEAKNRRKIQWQGKTWSPKTTFKIGHTFGKRFIKCHIPWNKNKENLKIHGENHHNWKGGVSKTWHKEMLAGRPRSKFCEICKRKGMMCFDHDHKTGKFRGWICRQCNVVLGLTNDSTKILTALIKYLKRCQK